MRLGIDASNLRAGGTATNLIQLLSAARPGDFGWERVIVWGGSAVLGRIAARDWLETAPQPLLEQAADPLRDRRHLQRAYWQRFQLAKLAAAARCDVVFAPGGTGNSGFRPLVTMSQNMLPFDLAEGARYGWSAARLRLWLLRRLQTRTFHAAQGVMFLTQYAREAVSRIAHIERARTVVVPHGIDRRFACPPRPQESIAKYSAERPFKLLYVSTIDLYKHQWQVVEALARLRSAGLPVVLDLVGASYAAGARKLAQALEGCGAMAGLIRCRGLVPYEQLPEVYAQADLKVFASSCENMPIILMEAMAAGLPIACSNKGPMPEVLRDAGVYFDPERPEEIAGAIRSLIESPQLRARKAQTAFELARQYSWERCAQDTFAFLTRCARPRQ